MKVLTTDEKAEEIGAKDALSHLTRYRWSTSSNAVARCKKTK
jgi:hypothetical protein